MAVTSAPGPEFPDQKGKINDGATKEVEQVQKQFENGKTCHQCRQRTSSFAASCKILKKDKPCPIKFCQKCLLNRYGEKAEEMAVLEDWKCPKCRGICNCSICMRRRGLLPTGILVHTAKATGFSSVSELLHVKGPENFGTGKIVKAEGVTPRKTTTSDHEPVLSTASTHGNENSFGVDGDLNLHPSPLLSCPVEKKIKKKKWEGLKEMQHSNQGDGQITKGGLQNIQNGDHGDGILLKKNKTKKPRISKGGSIPLQNGEQDRGILLKRTSPRGPQIPDIPLPQGTELKSLAGIELPLKDVGLALQFLEFCAAFEEILDLKEGEPVYILKELVRGGRGCRGRYSPVVQFHIQLLLLIEKDLGEDSPAISFKPGKNSWLIALKNCASRSKCIFEKLKLDSFSWELDDYDSLESSNKLRLLTFLCDEVLSTVKMRSWIDDQNSKSFEKLKQAKERVGAAKVKEKQLKQKIQEEVVKAIMANNGVPLCPIEHKALVSQFESDAAQAKAEVLESVRMVADESHRSDAVRTEPLFLDKNGCIYWRLKTYDDYDVLCQDVGTREAVESGDKWLFFDDGEEKEIEKYISSLRERRLQSKTSLGFHLQLASDPVVK